MKKHLSLCLIAMLLCAGLRAEFVFKKGYVITNAGDTVRGDVKINTKKELDLFKRVMLKLGETESKSYAPSKIKEYGYEDQRFVSRMIDGEQAFVRVLSSGNINLYEHQFEYYHGNDVLVDSEYFIEKSENASTSNEPKKVKAARFHKVMTDLVGEDSEFAKTKLEDKKYETSQMIEAVQEYNAWIQENKKTGES